MLVKDMPAWMQVDFFRRHLALLKEADPYDLLTKCENDLREAEIHLEQESKRPFQERCMAWVRVCFGEAKATDKQHRNKRFLEEALELVQSTDMTKETAHELVEYVFGREKGETGQEVGGVMTTLAAYCGANNLDMQNCAELELRRIWGKVDKIRAKELTKPSFDVEATLDFNNLVGRLHALTVSDHREVLLETGLLKEGEKGLTPRERESLVIHRLGQHQGVETLANFARSIQKRELRGS